MKTLLKIITQNFLPEQAPRLIEKMGKLGTEYNNPFNVNKIFVNIVFKEKYIKILFLAN